MVKETKGCIAVLLNGVGSDFKSACLERANGKCCQTCEKECEVRCALSKGQHECPAFLSESGFLWKILLDSGSLEKELFSFYKHISMLRAFERVKKRWERLESSFRKAIKK